MDQSIKNRCKVLIKGESCILACNHIHMLIVKVIQELLQEVSPHAGVLLCFRVVMEKSSAGLELDDVIHTNKNYSRI